MIYTSRSTVPVGIVSNIHYAELTDLAWNQENKLCASSRDGFITIIDIDVATELGEKMELKDIPENVRFLFKSLYSPMSID